MLSNTKIHSYCRKCESEIQWCWWAGRRNIYKFIWHSIMLQKWEVTEDKFNIVKLTPDLTGTCKLSTELYGTLNCWTFLLSCCFFSITRKKCLMIFECKVVFCSSIQATLPSVEPLVPSITEVRQNWDRLILGWMSVPVCPLLYD